MSAFANSALRSAAEALSEFTNKTVTTKEIQSAVFLHGQTILPTITSVFIHPSLDFR